MNRCSWAGPNKLMAEYHDKEWGVPLHDDTKLFEFLILEGAQAGLSWQTILSKRQNYRKAFNDFNPDKIAKYNSQYIKKLLDNPGIVRNRLKIGAAIINARKFIEIREEYGSFDKYIWQFVSHKPMRNQFRSLREIPATSKESDAMSNALKKRGFKFVGSTICYAFMQATGMVNDHFVSCFRHNQIK